MNINANLTNLIQRKKSVVLTRQSESNKIFKYIGGDSVIYKDLYVQSGTTGYAGHIYETGDTLSLNSESIDLNASNININGNISFDKINMNPIAIGVDCGLTNQSTLSIAIGFEAGKTSQNVNSIAIGSEAGSTGQGIQSVAIGIKAGKFNQGRFSVSIGQEAGLTGQANGAIAIGSRAGQNNQIQSSIAIGTSAGQHNQGTLAGNCIAIGTSAGLNNQGDNSIAIGSNSGSNQRNNCIAIGTSSGQFQVEGAIAIGSGAGSINNSLTQGQSSICIGVGARSSVSQSIVLNASGSELTASATSGFFVKPIRSGGGNNLTWNSDSGEITNFSSQRSHKDNIENLNTNTSSVFDLQPRTFTYKSNPASGTHIGYIAEEVAEINPNFANYNTLGGEPVGINFNTITVFLLEEIKKLKSELELLKSKL
jgi:hypothetical protein